MKRKIYTRRGEKEADFFAGFFIFALLLLLTPAVLLNFIQGPAQGLTGAIVAVAFLLLAGFYRPWMAIGGLGCLGGLIALGLLAALFINVVCSTGFR